jgi:hypothetical protein
MELIIEKLTKRLISVFNSFILETKYPSSIDDRKLKIIPESQFLNFNYTSTLEQYYEVDNNRVCYIHEKSVESDCKIILGHGTDPSNFEVKDPEPPEGLSDEELYEWRENMSDQYDFSYQSAKDEILSYYTKAFKNALSIIDKNTKFFESLTEVENIYVLGHSISSIDIKYFEAVSKHAINGAKWHVTYYSDYEKQRHLAALTEIGIKSENLIQLKMNELT